MTVCWRGKLAKLPAQQQFVAAGAISHARRIFQNRFCKGTASPALNTEEIFVSALARVDHQQKRVTARKPILTRAAKLRMPTKVPSVTAFPHRATLHHAGCSYI